MSIQGWFLAGPSILLGPSKHGTVRFPSSISSPMVGDTQKGVQQKGVLHKGAFCTFSCRNSSANSRFFAGHFGQEKTHSKRTKTRKNVQKTRHFAPTHATPPFIIPPLACTQNGTSGISVFMHLRLYVRGTWSQRLLQRRPSGEPALGGLP